MLVRFVSVRTRGRITDRWLQDNVPSLSEHGLRILLDEPLRRRWTEPELRAACSRTTGSCERRESLQTRV